MDHNRLNYLLEQFAAGTIRSGEQQELNDLLANTPREELVEQLAHQAATSAQPAYEVTDSLHAETFRHIMGADKVNRPLKTAVLRRISRRWLSAAAVILLLGAAGTWYLINRKEKVSGLSYKRTVRPEKDPGRNTALLTLADSSVLELDSLGNGFLLTQAGTRVVVTNGQLAYLPGNGQQPAGPAYNIITTPRGGEFNLTLPDGTRVWLNAASSLRFPTAFTGPKRQVELSGEAYLEVAEDKAHPFEVQIRDMQVAVLGTQFNIMGYEDEQEIVTTLVSGSVRVSAPGSAPRLLVPGEHAILANRTGGVLVEKADVEEETAWKNGRTYFNGVNIRQIMRQVARWYDVDVQFKDNVANMDFTCTVSRKDRLSKLLALLELTGAVHFTMEGNTIIVHK